MVLEQQPDCYLDTLLVQAPQLSEKHLEMLTWEPVIESADTSLVTLEWAMYEVTKSQLVQVIKKLQMLISSYKY